MELFFKDPIVQIIAELNEKNKDTLKRPLTVTDLEFTEVSSNEDTGSREVIARPASGAEYFGVIRNPGVKYRRYVGTRMFVVQPRIWGVNGETYPDLIKRMAKMYNLPEFTIEPKAGDKTKPYDFGKEVQSQKIDQGDSWLSFTMQIQFNASSLGWVGIFPITVYNAERDLGKIIKDTQLDALAYPDDTKGEAGSMSTLTYPIEFELPASAQATLTTVGNKLASDKDDDTVKAIIDQIMEYYEFTAGDDARASLESTVPGSEVIASNLAATTDTDKQVILKMVLPAGDTPMFIGNIYLNNPLFGASSGN